MNTKELRGVDVHGGLRVRLEYEGRTIHARHSAEAGVNVRGDVESRIVALARELGYLQAWLIAFRRALGEAMEKPGASCGVEPIHESLDSQALAQPTETERALREQVRVLREALKRHGAHDPGCYLETAARRCTCGLHAALTRTEPQP